MSDREVIKAALLAFKRNWPTGELSTIMAIIDAVEPIIRADEDEALARVFEAQMNPQPVLGGVHRNGGLAASARIARERAEAHKTPGYRVTSVSD